MVSDVAIIGSGFGGLGAAIRLRKSGVRDVVIFERASDLGGTWRDNTYPGCRCDVASNLYSFSFAPNPAWTNTYSYQPEIRSYLERVADEHDVRGLIRYDHDVAARYVRYRVKPLAPHHEPGRVPRSLRHPGDRWTCRTATARHQGLDTFQGPVMHTATWDGAIELAGKRVGVIGTGASAIQTVPEIAPLVATLDVFQRTPSWILPHLGHPVLERSQRLFTALPLAQRRCGRGATGDENSWCSAS